MKTKSVIEKMDWEINPYEDVIDSRDIIARIEALQEEESRSEDEQAELDALLNLASQAEGYGDWAHGDQLIRYSHFRDYAEELAEDCGMIDPKVSSQWPYTCIDWEEAAEELKQDYVEVDFAGTAYFMRA